MTADRFNEVAWNFHQGTERTERIIWILHVAVVFEVSRKLQLIHSGIREIRSNRGILCVS